MLVVADFNQFCSRDSSFSSKPEDAIVFYFPELITLFITIAALLSISTVKESLLLWMDRNQDPACSSCSRVLLWERQFFFPTDHNCSTLTLQCKLHLEEGIQLHNMSEQKKPTTLVIHTITLMIFCPWVKKSIIPKVSQLKEREVNFCETFTNCETQKLTFMRRWIEREWHWNCCTVN